MLFLHISLEHTFFLALTPVFFLSTLLGTLCTYVKIAIVLYLYYEIFNSSISKENEEEKKHHGNVSSLNIHQVILFSPTNIKAISEFVMGSYNFALNIHLALKLLPIIKNVI